MTTYLINSVVESSFIKFEIFQVTSLDLLGRTKFKTIPISVP
jgi:hypothetical protein